MGSEWLDKTTRRIHKILESGFKRVTSIRLDPDRIFLTLEVSPRQRAFPDR